MNKQQAVKLDKEIRAALVVTAEKVREFILAKAWTSLGHESLLSWVKSLSDIELGVPVVNLLTYDLIASGEADDEIALSLKGIGPEGVKNLRRQKRNGVPASLANRGIGHKNHRAQIMNVVYWTSRDEQDRVINRAAELALTVPEFLRQVALEYINAAV